MCFLALFVLALSPTPVAASTDCVRTWGWKNSISPDFIHHDGNFKYKIHLGSLEQHLPALSSLSVAGAIKLAAEQWNHQANAGYFTFAGYTDSEEPQGCYIVVRGADPAHDPPAFVNRGDNLFCCHQPDEPPYEGCTQFIVNITSTLDGDQVPWSVGEPGPNEIDLTAILVHEFGHILALGHPLPAEATECNDEQPCAVMRPMATLAGWWPEAYGTIGHRDLYEWDMRCARSTNPLIASPPWRQVGVHTRYHKPDGSFDDEVSFSPPELVTRISTSVLNIGGTWEWVTAFNSRRLVCFLGVCFWWYDPMWSPELDTFTRYPLSGESWFPIGPRAAVFSELDETIPRMVWTERDNASPDLLSLHHTRIAWSTDYFASYNESLLRSCMWQSGDFCPYSWARALVYAHRQMAFAWNSEAQRTVAAWPAGRERDVRVSVGVLEYALLARSYPAGIKSSVGVGVACRPGTGYNCLVAYVPTNLTLNPVRIKRFEAESGLNGHYPVFESGTHTIGSYNFWNATSADIALWYHTGTERFYIAHRTLVDDQPIRVLSSPSGETGTWSIVSWSFTHAPLGVSVASDGFDKNHNYVLIAR